MTRNVDIAIIGAGPVGLSLARALSAQGMTSLLLEKQPLAAVADPAPDGRDVAMTHLSREILGELGIWQSIPQDMISPIARAQVFNGSFDQRMDMAAPESQDALGFIVPNHLIRKAVYSAVEGDSHIEILAQTTARDIRMEAERCVLSLSSGETVNAELLVIADSRFSHTRKQLGIPASVQDFGKVMTVCRMAHEHPHHGVAHECFLYDGWTMAVLPLPGNHSSVVLTAKPEEARRIGQMAPEEFNAWVEEKFARRLGRMTLEGGRHAYPLVATYAGRFSGPRWVLMGDAAVGMHPVTAHGFNFGLRGVRTLCESIQLSRAAGEGVASARALLRYDRLHRKATRPLYLATNGIVRLYTAEAPAAKVARTVLLKGANMLAPVKGLLMKKLMEANENR